MSRRLFYRNVHARDHLEVFLVSAVTALLALRFYLSLTGYPQLGGHSFHIAHMLFGGLLMLIAIVINLSFLGLRAQRVSSVLGGAGFGIFIDELGKFITRDNNYFFRPTVGLIYAIFAILYLSFNFISRHQKLSSEEYQLNALQQLEEAVRHDMDHREKADLRRLLARADKNDPITLQLKELADQIQPVRVDPSWYSELLDKISDSYDKFWRRRRSNQVVAAIFVLEALIFLGAIIVSLDHSFDSFQDLFKHTDRYSSRLLIGQLASSIVALIFVLIGTYKLVHSRLIAYEWFRRSLLVNVFLTEFFIFSRIQLSALPGFIINLALLIVLRLALNQERRHHN